MKRFLTFFTVLMLIFIVAGCGGQKHKDGKTHVVMWIMPNSSEPANDLKAVLKPFEEANPDIVVDVVPLDWGSAWQKITTAATSSDTPDLCQLGTTWVGSIASMGAMMDLTEKVNEIGGEDLFVPAAWSTSAITGTDKVIAVPWFVDVRAMYYRTDVFKKLGLTRNSIRTWTGFQKSLEKIKQANLTINGKKVAPLGITGKNDWNVIHNFSPWIWSAGGRYVNKDLRSCALAEPETVKGLSYYIDLVRKGYVPIACLEQNTAQISSGFNNGYYAVYFDGPYALKSLTTPPERGGSSDLPVAQNFAVAPYPSGPMGRSTFAGGSNITMFKASRNKEAAWKVVVYLTTDQNAQVAYAKLTGFLPAKKQAFEHAYFKDDPFRKVFKDSVNYARAYPCIPAWGPIETVVLTRRFGLLWDKLSRDPEGFNVEKIEEELQIAAKEVDVILEQQ